MSTDIKEIDTKLSPAIQAQIDLEVWAKKARINVLGVPKEYFGLTDGGA